MRKTLLTASLLAILPLGFGQSARPLVGKSIAVPSARFPQEWYPKDGGSSTDAPIAGAPYSAIWTMTTTVPNSEGKPVGTWSWRTLKWRDSAGRTREEELFSEQPNLEHSSNVITVEDTIQHCEFTWNAPVTREEERVAIVRCDSLVEGRTEDSVAKLMIDPKPEVVHDQLQAGAPPATTTITPLGKRIMQGLEVVGIRTVTTQLDAQGKMQDTKEGEIWWSPDLYESILTTYKTGQNTVTFALTGIVRAEPDETLFYPPQGYRIQKQAEVPPLSVPPQP